MPSNKPVITRPTICPRCASGASTAAAGTMSCASVAISPTSRLAISRPGRCPAIAAAPNASASNADFNRIRLRRSNRSPSGASSRMPIA